MDAVTTILVPMIIMAVPIIGAAVWTIGRLKLQGENLCKELGALREVIGRLNDRMDAFNQRMDQMEQRCTAHRAAPQITGSHR